MKLKPLAVYPLLFFCIFGFHLIENIFEIERRLDKKLKLNKANFQDQNKDQIK
jgi:hypothetical protein